MIAAAIRRVLLGVLAYYAAQAYVAQCAPLWPLAHVAMAIAVRR